MSAFRWSLHAILCAWYRWRANEALADVAWTKQAQIEARNRMARALAREEEEQRAWKRYQQRVQQRSPQCAD